MSRPKDNRLKKPWKIEHRASYPGATKDLHGDDLREIALRALARP
jgi:hypothetical protein